MAITHVALSDTIATWRTRHNEQATLQGDLANLINDSAGSKANLVIAINEINMHADDNDSDIGTRSSLTTTTKLNLVAAINEIDSGQGVLSTLNTDSAGSRYTLVLAINEVKRQGINVYNAAGTLLNT
jgi:hypothetical protein|tara:strand:+ start:50 stop:433 length:384 start_codon:yes stop_codon:yes gene_type:complete